MDHALLYTRHHILLPPTPSLPPLSGITRSMSVLPSFMNFTLLYSPSWQGIIFIPVTDKESNISHMLYRERTGLKIGMFWIHACLYIQDKESTYHYNTI